MDASHLPHSQCYLLTFHRESKALHFGNGFVLILLGNESCGIPKLDILPETVKDTTCSELDSKEKPEAAIAVEAPQC